MANLKTPSTDDLRFVPKLRALAMIAAGNPCMETIMNAIAGGVEYGIEETIKQDN